MSVVLVVNMVLAFFAGMIFSVSSSNKKEEPINPPAQEIAVNDETETSKNNEEIASKENEVISLLKQEQFEAETKLVESVQEKIDLINFIEKSEKELRGITSEEKRKKLEKIIYEKKELLAKQNISVKERETNLSKIFDQLADEYEKIENTGDPVDIDTGRFVAEYNDYVAEDYLDIFKVHRNLDYGKFKESFGQNWICSLDTRLIRCNYKDYSESLDNAKQILEIIDDIIKGVDIFKNKYNYIPAEISDQYSKSIELKEFYKNEIEYIEYVIEKRKEISEKNKYVLYGKYENEKYSIGDETLIILIDSDGKQHLFEKKSETYWEPVWDIDKVIFKLKEINNGDKGFILEYTNGNKLYYSEYGILEKYIDKNNNETIFKNQNGRINEIILKTGEKLFIKRNDSNFITSIWGNISGETKYTYENERLVKVIDNFGISNEYKYNHEGELTEIVKGENHSVKINYEFNKDLNHNVCTSVENDNGNTEYFSIDTKNKKMVHNVFNEGIEIFYFDENGKTIRYKDIYNNKIDIKRNEQGLIKSIEDEKGLKQFVYDNNWNIVNVLYDNGSKETFTYNSTGEITELKDRDGLTNDYQYDNSGNLIKSFYGNCCCGTYNYYENGLVKQYWENGICYDLNYNNFGEIIEKKETLPNGKVNSYKWNYDKNNKLVSFVDKNGMEKFFTYEHNKKTEKSNNCTISYYFNNRNKEIKKETYDNLSKKKYVKETIYDKFGNISKILIDGELFAEYEYYKNNCLKEYTIWNNPKEKESLKYGIKIEYKYNNDWMLCEKVQTIIKSNTPQQHVILENYDYVKKNDKVYVNIKEYLKPKKTLIYNKEGKIIKAIYNNYYLSYEYSKGGRLLSETDSNNNQIKYIYNIDGSYKKIVKNLRGNTFNYYYNSRNQLEKITDYFGVNYFYKYDNSGNNILEKGPLFTINKSFDDSNRLTYYKFQDDKGNILSEYQVLFDDITGEKKILVDDNVQLIEKYDCFSRVIDRQSASGHYFYEYDYFSNCITECDYYGNKTERLFSPDGQIIAEYFPDGSTKNYEYNSIGNITEIKVNGKSQVNCLYTENSNKLKFLGTEKEIKFDNNNQEYYLKNYDTGKSVIKRNNNQIVRTDSKGNNFIYEYDKFGQLIKEINQGGKVSESIYDQYGIINKVKDYTGRTKTYSYDLKENKEITTYDTGLKKEIVRDGTGRIVKLSSGDYTIEYNYDKRGKLLSEYSTKSNSLIKYEYDSFARCIRKSGPNFDYSFDYDEMSRLKKANDNKAGIWISFEYDCLSRIKTKRFSNGGVSTYSYNNIGKIETVKTVNNLGLILFYNYIKYDDYGRIISVTDKDNFESLYNYDESGRLVESITPFTEEKKNFFKRELIDCGYFDADFGNNPIRWKEKYEYDTNGNIVKIENPYGIINYNYDKLNRLISKNYNNTNEYGVTISWNDNNCLEKIESKTYKISLIYNEVNRPEKMIKENKKTGHLDITEYGYDAYGRRVLEQTNENTIEYLYDGFSTVAISKQLLNNSGSVATIVNKDFAIQNSQDKYRHVSREDYSNVNSMRNVNNSKYSPYGMSKMSNSKMSELNKDINNQAKNDMGFYSVMQIGNVPLIISYVDGNKSNAVRGEICVTDFRNDMVGTLNSLCDYESFEESDLYKNTYDNYNQIINIGYRDYIPTLKIFTTEDPKRDGGNWFALCACDPLNYKDIDGLQKISYSNSENYRFKSKLIDFANFNKLDYLDYNKRHLCYMHLYEKYDCADTVTQMHIIAALEAGLPFTSEFMENFAEKSCNGFAYSAMPTVDTFRMALGEHVRKSCDGYDEDTISYYEGKKLDEEKELTETEAQLYKDELNKKEKFYEQVKNPNILDVGSVLLWQNSEHPNPNSPAQCGHAITVVARKFDKNGNVAGFITMEGHSDGNKTELTYISVDEVAGKSTVDDYMGKFMGIYEVEEADATAKVPKCTK